MDVCSTYCTKCGTRHQENDLYCAHCGSSLQQAAEIINDHSNDHDTITSADNQESENNEEAEAWNDKGIELDGLGRHSEAIGFYDKVLELNPNDEDIWNNKGISLDDLGLNKEAIKCYEEALALDSREAETWYNKGSSLSKLGKV